MLKYITLFLIWLIAVVVILIATGNITDDTFKVSCDKPKEETKDPVSCEMEHLKLIAKGVITNISYQVVQVDKYNAITYITFNVDGQPMTLNFNKTKYNGGGSGYYSEIYGTDGKGNIESGKYYYIYDKGGYRTIWSKTPKALSSGRIVDEK